MKYKLLTIVGATILLTGCGQAKDFSANQAVREPIDEPTNDFTAEEIKQIQLEAKMLAEYGEPAFEDLLKDAKKDAEGNIILTSQMRHRFTACENADAGFLPANDTIHFESVERGISFKVPYNSAWKFCGYTLSKYDEMAPSAYGDDSGSLEFGPLQLLPESDNSLNRKYHLAFMPANTPEKLIAKYNDSPFEIKKIKINNLNVVRMYDPPPQGMGCSSLLYYVFGEKATYEFGGYCVETKIGDQKYSADEFSKELEKIVSTVKLL